MQINLNTNNKTPSFLGKLAGSIFFFNIHVYGAILSSYDDPFIV